MGLNRFDKSMDEEVHKHLEIDKGDTVLTISVFDTPSTGDIEIDICRTDKEEKLKFNSYKMFLTKEQLKEFAYFFSDIERKVSIRNSHEFVEDIRLDMIAEKADEDQVFALGKSKGTSNKILKSLFNNQKNLPGSWVQTGTAYIHSSINKKSNILVNVI